MVKKSRVINSAQNEGVCYIKEFNVGESERPQKYWVPGEVLGWSNISVEINCNGATGTSGDVEIMETNVSSGVQNRCYTTTEVLTIAENSKGYVKLTNILSNYIALDFSGVTFGTSGTIEIIVTGKRG